MIYEFHFNGIMLFVYLHLKYVTKAFWLKKSLWKNTLVNMDPIFKTYLSPEFYECNL